MVFETFLKLNTRFFLYSSLPLKIDCSPAKICNTYRMSFELPEVFAPRKNEMSPTTAKIYKGRLNTLAKLGFGDTPDALKKNHKDVIKHLKGLGDSTKIRGILTAIFWVMPDEYRKSINPYYKYYQKVLPKISGDGTKWVAKKDFVAPAAEDNL